MEGKKEYSVAESWFLEKLAGSGQVEGYRRQRQTVSWFWVGVALFAGFNVGVLTTLWLMGL